MTEERSVARPSGAGRAIRAASIGTRALALGAVVAFAGLVLAQATGHPIVPLYDGVIVPDPYHYLDPQPGQPGQPIGATATVAVKGGQSDLLAVATPENIPQAQAFVIPGGLDLPVGTTRIDVSIAAVEPPGQPTDGHIVGNVYAFAITDQSGAALRARPDAEASVELRAPDPSTQGATLIRWDGSAWQPLKTAPADVGGLFSAVVTDYGDFAVLVPGPAPSTSTASGAPVVSSGAAPTTGTSGEGPAPSPAASGGGLDRGALTLVLGGAALAIVLLVAAAALLPSRRRPPRGGDGRPRAGGGAGRRRPES